MPIRTKALRVTIVCFSALLPAGVQAEGIDTEHIFGFMIGTDVGSVGEREFQTETTGRFGKERRKLPGRRPGVRAGIRAGQEFPDRDRNDASRLTTSAAFPVLTDRRQLAWQGVSLDLRYRFLDRETAPFGLTLAVESHGDRIDEVTAAAVRSYGTEFTLALRSRTGPERRGRRAQSDLSAGMDALRRRAEPRSRSPPSAPRSA